jgi:hypothetical protein
MTGEDLKAMRADLTAAIGPLAAANVFFAWERAIAERMAREASVRKTEAPFSHNAETPVEPAQNTMSGGEP